MLHDKICSRLELLQFAHNEDNPTVSNFCSWLECKTNNKYTIVEKELIKDMLQALNSYTTSANIINEDLNRRWKDVIEALML